MVSNETLGATMADEDDKLLIYFESEEHLVRRLGAAVISCWTELPGPVRAHVIARAIKVLDEDHSEHLGEQMKKFVSDHTRKL